MTKNLFIDMLDTLQTAETEIEEMLADMASNPKEDISANRTLRRLKRVIARARAQAGSDKPRIYPFELGEVTDAKRQPIAGLVVIKKDGIAINFEGYGRLSMEPDRGDTIWIEQHEGDPQVAVWADIQQDDPTHLIDLNLAREDRRIPDEKLGEHQVDYPIEVHRFPNFDEVK